MAVGSGLRAPARNRGLLVQDPELFELLEEQHAILKNYVGGSFNSIHQYLSIRQKERELHT